MRPLSGGGQHCTSFRLVTDPPGVRVRAYRDRLGNHVQHLEVLEDHDRISITALSEVSTAAGVLRLGARAVAARASTTTSRRRSTRRSRMRSVELSATAEGQGTETERAVEVMRTVRSLLVYEPGATDVMTRADAALALGRGVCQDFAHVMLAACRRAGIPSRYVSGYLYDPLGEGEVASHAWVDVLDAERGWVSLDPTHDREQTEAYVRVAVGRDYADVPPTRGVFKGTAEETLEVAVRIAVL